MIWNRVIGKENGVVEFQVRERSKGETEREKERRVEIGKDKEQGRP